MPKTSHHPVVVLLQRSSTHEDQILCVPEGERDGRPHEVDSGGSRARDLLHRGVRFWFVQPARQVVDRVRTQLSGCIECGEYVAEVLPNSFG
jgi:hypothetical protein